MLKRLLISAALLAFAVPAFAQSCPTPNGTATDYICLRGTLIKDASSGPLASGTAIITAVDNNGNPTAFVAHSGGQVTGGRQIFATVTGGALYVNVVDAFTTGGTAKTCYNIGIVDNSTGQYVLGHDPAGWPSTNQGSGTPGYECVQPSVNSSTQSYWCSTGTVNACDFDYYAPNTAPTSISEAAPTLQINSSTVGPYTSAGVTNVGTPEEAKLNVVLPTFNFTNSAWSSGTNYNPLDVVSNGSSPSCTYTAIQASGPANGGAQNPSSATAYWSKGPCDGAAGAGASPGSALQPGSVNGVKYASQQGSSSTANTAIATALATAHSYMVGDTSYGLTELVPGLSWGTGYCTASLYQVINNVLPVGCTQPWGVNTTLWDQRGNVDRFVYHDPLSPDAAYAYSLGDPRNPSGNNAYAKEQLYSIDADYGATIFYGFADVAVHMCCGHNQNPFGQGITGALGGKVSFEPHTMETYDFTAGQKIDFEHDLRTTGKGDSYGVEEKYYFSGCGLADQSDEGCGLRRMDAGDPGVVPQGTITTVGSGYVQVNITSTNGAGDQGEGRFLADLSKAACGNESGASVTDTTHHLCSGNHLTNTTQPNTQRVGSFTGPSGGFPASTYIGTITPFVSNQPTITSVTGSMSGTTVTLSVTSPSAPTVGETIAVTSASVSQANTTTTIATVSGSNPYTITYTGSGSASGSITGAQVVLQLGTYSPGTQTVALSTTSGTLTTGNVCIADKVAFEQATVSSTDGSTTAKIAFNDQHSAGAQIFQGGLCGWGLTENANFVAAGAMNNTDDMRQLWPLVGSSTDGTLAYAWNIDVLPASINTGTAQSRKTNSTYNSVTISSPSTNISYNSTTGLVTVTCSNCGFYTDSIAGAGQAANFPNINGLSITVSSTDTGAPWNGTYTINVLSPTSFTYTAATGFATETYPTASLVVTYQNDSYTLYPIARVTRVLNPSTNKVDGYFGLQTNAVSWATSDVVEEPHWTPMNLTPTHVFIHSYLHQQQPWGNPGPSYSGRVTGQLYGETVQNNASTSNYLGFGGSDAAPYTAHYMAGWWNNLFTSYAAPSESVIDIGCKPTATVNGNTVGGCADWASGYHVLHLRGNASGYTGQLDFIPTDRNGNNTRLFQFNDTLVTAYSLTFGPYAIQSFLSGATTVGTCTAGSGTSGCPGLTTQTISATNIDAATMHATTLNVGSCTGCGSASPGGSTNYAQVNNGSGALAGYATLQATSTTATVGGSGDTVTISGTTNINTTASAGQTNVGNSSNYLELYGSVIYANGSFNALSNFSTSTSGSTTLNNNVGLGTGVAINGSSTSTINSALMLSTKGTAISSGNIALSGWGSGAAASSISGYSQRFRFTVTAGSSPSANPTITVTLPNAFPAAPICMEWQVAGTSGAITQGTETTTSTGAFTWTGTPTASSTYTFVVDCR